MDELSLITDILRETSGYVKEQYARRGTVEVSSKRHVNDLCTAVDLAVQDEVVRRIRGAFPGELLALMDES